MFGAALPALAASSQPSAGPGSSPPANHMANQNKTNDGKEFLEEMSRAADSLKSYAFVSEMTVFKGSKTINERCNFYFKKPKQIRAEEVGQYKKGSVAVLQKDGKVRGHLGGVLSKIVATVDARSEWVVSANDYPLVDSDFFSMCQVMLDFVKEGKQALVTEQAVQVVGQPKPVYVLELYTDSSQKRLMKRAYVDPESLLPVEWFDYKDGKLFAHTLWRNVRANIDLNDSLFQI